MRVEAAEVMVYRTPIFLDISRASGGMTINQGGRDEEQGPQREVWGQ
jgi:hypothetical protein